MKKGYQVSQSLVIHQRVLLLPLVRNIQKKILGDGEQNK